LNFAKFFKLDYSKYIVTSLFFKELLYKDFKFVFIDFIILTVDFLNWIIDKYIVKISYFLIFRLQPGLTNIKL